MQQAKIIKLRSTAAYKNHKKNSIATTHEPMPAIVMPKFTREAVANSVKITDKVSFSFIFNRKLRTALYTTGIVWWVLTTVFI